MQDRQRHERRVNRRVDSLGEDFEKKEDELFDDDGFEKVLDKVAGIEKRFGTFDLAQFTPKV